ncbi:MAG TPA: hypothetical protein VGM83_12510 [Devosiaceae bacterium]|jgi:hypothetical protein
MAIRALYPVGIALALLLTACDSMTPLPPPSNAPMAAPGMDPTVLAFDMPAGVQPVPELSTVASMPLAEQRISLQLTDPGNAGDRLPAPAKGRAYYFLGPPTGLDVDTRTLTPSFCTNQPTEPSLLRYSVLLLGDGTPQPITVNQPIAKPGDPALPRC